MAPQPPGPGLPEQADVYKRQVISLALADREEEESTNSEKIVENSLASGQDGSEAPEQVSTEEPLSLIHIFIDGELELSVQ